MKFNDLLVGKGSPKVASIAQPGIMGRALMGRALMGQALTGPYGPGPHEPGPHGPGPHGLGLMGRALTGQALMGRALIGRALMGHLHNPKQNNYPAQQLFRVQNIEKCRLSGFRAVCVGLFLMGFA